MKNITYKYVGSMVIVGIIIILILTVIKNADIVEYKNSIFDNEKEFWNVYIDKLSTEALNTDGIPYEGFQENGQDYVNYWVQACNVISRCFSYKYIEKDEESLNQAKETLLNMKNTFDRYGKFPRPEYKSQNLEYGWVSSMDAPTIMVASQMLYELTEDNIYADFVKNLQEYVVLTTEEGGIISQIKMGAYGLLNMHGKMQKKIQICMY